MKRIYISGAIRNNPNYKKQFADAESLISKSGYIAINPASAYNKTIEQNFNDNELLEIDLKILEKCDTIYMLKGWESSVGANIELNLAQKTNKNILYE